MNPVMWCLRVVVTVVLVVSAEDDRQAECEDSVPPNCSFTHDFCGWNEHNWKISKKNEFAYLPNKQLSGSLESETTCVISPISHCLKFRYKNTDDTCGLSVSIVWPHNGSEQELWHFSQTANWMDASVPVESDSDFSLIITGTRETRRNDEKVYIDDIVYAETACEDETATSAVPSRETSTTTVVRTASASVALTTSASPGQGSSAGAGDDATRSTSPVTPTTAFTSTTTSSSSPAQGALEDGDASAGAGTIVGAVLAVVVVVLLVVGVVLVIFFRRNHLVCWKIRSEDKLTPSQIGLDEASGGLTDDSYSELDVHDVIRPMRYSSLGDMGTSRLSMEDYSVIRDVDQNDHSSDAAQLRSSLYCMAQGIATGTDNPSAADSLEDPYEIGDDERASQLKDSPENDDYNKMSFDHRGGGVIGEDHIYSNDCLYDHISKAGVTAGTTETSLCETQHQRSEQSDSPLAPPGEPAQEPQTIPGGTHQTLEDTARQNAPLESTSLYHIAGDIMTQTPEPLPPSGEQTSEDFSTSTEHGIKAARELPIREDSTSPKADGNTTSVYHILGEQTAPTPHTTTTDNYFVLKDALTEGNAAYEERRINPKSPQSYRPEFTPLSLEAGSDYNRLKFDQSGRGVEVNERGGEHDVYSHLKEGGEDTYDEVIRHRKVEIIDQDYSHIQ